MLKNRWMKLPCSRVTVQSRQSSPSATAALSSWSASYSACPSDDSSADSETMTVAPMSTAVAEMSGPSPRPLAKYRREARLSPVSLVSQPSRVAISALSSGGARRSAWR